MKKVKNLILLLLIIPVYFYGQEIDSLMLYSWKLNIYNQKEIIPQDTGLSMFEVYEMNFKNSYSNNYLSNIGQASETNLFFNKQNSDFIFANAHYQYMLHNNSLKYYNTHKRYTLLSYYSNLSKKNNNQVLNVLHTQNITPDWNFGLEYNMISSTGNFIAQSSSINDIVVQTSYTGHKYRIHANFIYNNVKNENNGGIQKEYVSVDNIKANANVLPAYLNASNTILTNREVNILQSIDFNLDKDDSLNTDTSISKNTFKLSHKFNYKYDRLKYYHTGDDFYEQFLYDTVNTFDSTYLNQINNALYFSFIRENNKNTFELSAILGADIEENYSYYKSNFINTYTGGLLNFKNNSFETNILLKYYLTDRRKNDIVFNAKFLKPVLNNKFQFIANISYKNVTPHFFEEHYYSNNYAWDTTFNHKKNISSINLILKRKTFKFGVYYSLLNNYIYFKDTSANQKLNLNVFQYTSNINYASVYLQKDFVFKHWIINIYGAYQYSSQQNILAVPQVATFLSFSYLPNIIKGVLKGGPGVKVYYNTSFIADAYSPAGNIFYRQTNEYIGNYPKIDVFLKFRLKRARLFFMLQHINFGMSGDNIYSSVNQPLNKMAFRFGVSWSFYD